MIIQINLEQQKCETICFQPNVISKWIKYIYPRNLRNPLAAQ